MSIMSFTDDQKAMTNRIIGQCDAIVTISRLLNPLLDMEGLVVTRALVQKALNEDDPLILLEAEQALRDDVDRLAKEIREKRHTDSA